MKHSTPTRRGTLGVGQIDMLLGLSLGLSVLSMAVQAWGVHWQWWTEQDLRTELLQRTPWLERALLRLSRQAGSRPLVFDGQHWQASAAYVALPPGQAPTWVHARAIHDRPELDPNCQNTRVWAKDADQAPALLQDQFDWVDGQLKCKDTAQPNARWQSWVEQVRGWQAWWAWQSGSPEEPRWRWRATGDAPAQGVALGVRLCLTLQASAAGGAGVGYTSDCLGRASSDTQRMTRVWTRQWALRVEGP
ncbi:MAG: hypothetical protein QM527_08150 [Alphaproteobacteria bacterium]|nr:hypothetical protein [Alphaproteobacteria bacterium]